MDPPYREGRERHDRHAYRRLGAAVGQPEPVQQLDHPLLHLGTEAGRVLGLNQQPQRPPRTHDGREQPVEGEDPGYGVVLPGFIVRPATGSTTSMSRRRRRYRRPVKDRLPTRAVCGDLVSGDWMSGDWVSGDWVCG